MGGAAKLKSLTDYVSKYEFSLNFTNDGFTRKLSKYCHMGLNMQPTFD